MVITHEGDAEADERFRRYSHRLLQALRPLPPIRKAIVVLNRPEVEGRFELEVCIYTSTRSISVKHTAPNALAAMDICYYDLRKRLARRHALRRIAKPSVTQRIVRRIAKKRS